MSKKEKILASVLSGNQDNNILFTDLCNIIDMFGFDKRIKGSHHIYYKENVIEVINIQPEGKMAKPYQVKQVRDLILKYGWEIVKK